LRYQVSPDDVTKMLQNLQLLDRSENRHLLREGVLQKRFASLAKIMLQNELLPVAPKLDTLLDSSFVADDAR
jgi:hypothetical protein